MGNIVGPLAEMTDYCEVMVVEQLHESNRILPIRPALNCACLMIMMTPEKGRDSGHEESVRRLR
jgi:hypothetical protein